MRERRDGTVARLRRSGRPTGAIFCYPGAKSQGKKSGMAERHAMPKIDFGGRADRRVGGS
jgi:hypothetical protein